MVSAQFTDSQTATKPWPTIRLPVVGLASFLLVAAVIGPAIGYSSLYLFHLVAALLVVCYLLDQGPRIELPSLGSRAHVFWLFLGAWYLVSLIWCLNVELWVAYIFYLSCGFLVMFTVIFLAQDMTGLQRVLTILAVIFGIEIVIALLEIATPFRLPVSKFSSYASLMGRESLVEAEFSTDVIQRVLSSPTGFNWNPNNLAATMVFVLPFFLFWPGRWLRYLGTLAVLIIIGFSGSRACYAGVLLVFAVWGLGFRLRRAVMTMGALVFLVLFGGAVLKFALEATTDKADQVMSVGTAAQAYISAEQSGIRGSENRRIVLTSNGFRALRQSYGLGVGAGGSKEVQLRAGGIGTEVQAMHNFWVEVLVDGGILVGGLFIAWYLYTAIRLYLVAITTRNQNLRYFASATAAGFAGFSVGMVSPSSVVYMLPMWILFGLACATLNLAGSHPEKLRESAAR